MIIKLQELMNFIEAINQMILFNMITLIYVYSMWEAILINGNDILNFTLLWIFILWWLRWTLLSMSPL